jgi:hypothetical protein
MPSRWACGAARSPGEIWETAGDKYIPANKITQLIIFLIIMSDDLKL